MSSPVTRALQTAAVISARLNMPLSVEFDLREWVPDLNYTWTGPPSNELIEEFWLSGDERPDGEQRPWEQLSSVRRRVRRVLDRMALGVEIQIVVTHQVVIQAITSESTTKPGRIRSVRL